MGCVASFIPYEPSRVGYRFGGRFVARCSLRWGDSCTIRSWIGSRQKFTVSSVTEWCYNKLRLHYFDSFWPETKPSMMVMKCHLLQAVSKLITVGTTFLVSTRCLMATTSWHAYDQDLVQSRSLLLECQIFQNSTIPQHYSSRSSRSERSSLAKTYHSMGLWPGNSKTYQIAETFRNDV